MMREPIAVVGAGSWGTALANLLAKKGLETRLWSYEADVAESIQRESRNCRYLSEVVLDPRLRASSDIEEVVSGAGVVLSVSPSHVVRQVIGTAVPFLREDAFIVSASKGIEFETLSMMDRVLADVLPAEFRSRTAFLSGPSFALEVAREYPTAVTMAAADPKTATTAQELFQTEYFRVYTTGDVTGVETGGSLKNVIAIASGIVVGMGYGHNTIAALITRGLAEMTRLGVALGAEPLTLAGLAGMGDLILTCTGALSRNRSLGIQIGQGQTLEQVISEMTMVAEGVRTTRSARALAHREGVGMPIVEEVYAMLFEGKSPEVSVEQLMTRDPKPERDRF